MMSSRPCQDVSHTTKSSLDLKSKCLWAKKDAAKMTQSETLTLSYVVGSNTGSNSGLVHACPAIPLRCGVLSPIVT